MGSVSTSMPPTPLSDHGGRLQAVLMRHPTSYLSKLWGGGGGLVGSWGGGVGWRVWGGGSAGGGVPRWGGGATPDPLLPHAYLQGGCVFGAALGKLLVAVVKRGCRWAGVSAVAVVIFHFATNDIC